MESPLDTTHRPMNLDLIRMKFPPMAIVSILHRLSGVVLFLLIPLMLHLLYHSLHSQASFVVVRHSLSQPWMSFFVWMLISAACFHLLAGIRHMTMDLGFGEGLRSAHITAYAVLFLEIVVLVLAGVWLW